LNGFQLQAVHSSIGLPIPGIEAMLPLFPAIGVAHPDAQPGQPVATLRSKSFVIRLMRGCNVMPGNKTASSVHASGSRSNFSSKCSSG
jgi:hypothetical protein